MSDADLVIRGARVCLPGGFSEVDVAVAGGKIVALGDKLTAKVEFDASQRYLLPGAIDAHVHYNEPGRTGWEGWASGSLASALGGASCVFEMPLNAFPPTLDGKSFRLKQAAAEASSVVDFGLGGGLTPANLDKLEELASCGVVGFKAFMCSSGMEEFPRANLDTLRAGMTVAAHLGLVVAVHAEDEDETAQLAARSLAAGRRGVRDYLDSRPVSAEIKAIDQACEMAGETGCSLHVVHVSCGEGLVEIARARSRGVDVTVETCPHYLLLEDGDMAKMGGRAKCAPPLRGPAIRADLLRRVLAGEVDTIGTDHSPCPPEMKEGDDFFKVWGGVSGAQQFLPSLWAAGIKVEEIVRMVSTRVAARFGLDRRKGSIALGMDADFILVEGGIEETFQAADLVTRHPISPYFGRAFPAAVRAIWVGGELVWSQSGGPGAARGRLVRPLH